MAANMECALLPTNSGLAHSTYQVTFSVSSLNPSSTLTKLIHYEPRVGSHILSKRSNNYEHQQEFNSEADQPTRQLVWQVVRFQFSFALELTRTHKAHRETQSGVVVWQLRNKSSVECAD